MKIIRWVLGRIILVIEFVMTPKGVQRNELEQQRLDAETSRYSLYQYRACPFCVKVRHAIKKQSLKIDLIDAKSSEKHRVDLLAQGGELKVPCLRINTKGGEDTWLYESGEIIRFLNQRADAIVDDVAAVA
ncbi:MAG: glutathione S-transferase N-terminal domain-containing protein [Gammaproteobacteria bacterium]|nr:glutathione S-transferase N-terminal domain-containing protein [Gammaproteobacteria bacterium]